MVPEPELIVCLIRGKMKHAGLKGNDQPDRLAGKKSGLRLGKYAVLRSLRPYLWAQSRGHHTIDRLEERGVDRGSARRSSLKEREKAIVNQTNIMEPFQRQRWGNFSETGWRA